MSDALQKYTVDPLDVRAIPQARVHLIIGRRNSGKTTLLVDLLFNLQERLQFGIVIAGSIGSVIDIRKFHPDTFIFEDFDPTTLEQFWDKVKSINGKLRRRGKPMVNFYIVLDDTGFDERMWNDKTLKVMMMNGRQYNLDMYICLQYMKGITTSMRGQVDYCYIFKEKAPENLKKIYDTFAGGYFGSLLYNVVLIHLTHSRAENRFVFESVFRQCTLDKRTLVVRSSDNPAEEGDFEGGILFYKAKLGHRDFTIGCDEMWKYHLAQYNEDYESDEEKFADRKTHGVEAPRKKSQLAVQLRKPKPAPAAVVRTTA